MEDFIPGPVQLIIPDYRLRSHYLKKYRPDKFLNRPPELARAAEEKTRQINTAYGILRKKNIACRKNACPANK
jgi:preprotein translocase subunit Sec63